MRKAVLLFLFFPALALGHNGSAYTLGFNGSSTHVDVADRTMNCSADLTVECWVKFAAVEGEQTIMAKTELPVAGETWTWEFGLSKRGSGGPEDGTICFVVGSTTDGSSRYLQSKTVVTADTWYHIAAVMNKTSMLLYIDGALEATGTFDLKRRSDGNGDLTFGSTPEYPAGLTKDGSCLNGELDDVRIWGYARSAAQIKGGTLLVLKGDESGLQAYYPMSNGGGETLDDDQKDGKNRGTIVDGTWMSAEALAVVLTSFTVGCPDAHPVLQWSTASEVNNYGFSVERRDGSGTAWTTVGFVGGHGTSTAPHSYDYVDTPERPGNFAYRLKQIDLDGSVHYSEQVMVEVSAWVTDVSSDVTVPLSTTLAQNYPNPFNPGTMIEFTMAENGHATLTVYDMLGREVAVLADGMFAWGVRHRVHFDGSRLASGVYLYRLTAHGRSLVRSLILTK